MTFALGQATHFVQNLNQPLHAAWGETRAEHNEIEAQMLYRSWQKDHAYRGFMLVKNYSCFAYGIAQNSSQHARALSLTDRSDASLRSRETRLTTTRQISANDLLECAGATAGVAVIRDLGTVKGNWAWVALLIGSVETRVTFTE